MKKLQYFIGIFQLSVISQLCWAKPYAVVTRVIPVGSDCIWVDVSVFDDNNTPGNPQDDIRLGSGGTLICGLSKSLTNEDGELQNLDELHQMPEYRVVDNLVDVNVFLNDWIEIYPNPVRLGEKLNIKLHSEQIQVSGIKVLDGHGREVLRLNDTITEFNLPNSAMPRVYYLLFYNIKGDIIDTEKLVIE
jgi:hypothetical protein